MCFILPFRLAPLLAVASSCIALAQYKTINPRVQEVVAAVSEDHIAETMKKLESFGTRNVSSSITDPAHGVGAARANGSSIKFTAVIVPGSK